MRSYPTILERVALAVPEQRRDLGVSITLLAKLAGVSRPTVVKIDRGFHVRPDLLRAVARELTMLEAYAPPTSTASVEMVDDLAPAVVHVPVEWPPLPGEGVTA
jgi:predicted transcriptional regulator